MKSLFIAPGKKIFFEHSPKINFRAAKIDFWRVFNIKFPVGAAKGLFRQPLPSKKLFQKVNRNGLHQEIGAIHSIMDTNVYLVSGKLKIKDYVWRFK